jgi:hypothetical protein
MGNGADLLVLMNLAEPAGFFDGVPHAIISQIYNTDVTNISIRNNVEPGSVPNSKASICA